MTYTIGDIHGCNRSFQALIQKLELEKGDQLVLLGDYIDRGPDSKGVVDTIFNLREAGQEVVCLRGNHEQLLLDTLTKSRDLELWLMNGGRQTLRSFDVEHPEEIPENYLDFFVQTRLWYETKGFLCVHGGLDFSSPDPLQQPETLMWMRRWYADIDYNWLGKRIVLHGHTPEDMDTIEAQHKHLDEQQYLNLDNGCVYANLSHQRGDALGRLVGFCLENRRLIWQECVD